MIEKKINSSAAISAERIQSMPLDPLYKEVIDLPIPLHKGVLVRRLTDLDRPTIIKTTPGGIHLPDAIADNSTDTKDGIIYAVGPDCSEFLRVGLRCQISSMVDTFFYHHGVMYYKLDEFHVYFIVPDPTTLIHNGIKKESEVRRKDKLEEQKEYLNRMNKMDGNEKDKKLDKTKGKTRKLINK